MSELVPTYLVRVADEVDFSRLVPHRHARHHGLMDRRRVGRGIFGHLLPGWAPDGRGAAQAHGNTEQHRE